MNDILDDHIFDYSKITDTIYIGSDLCRGNYCPIHSEDFKKLGVCAEINLKAESKEIPPDELDIYAWLPVKDKGSPSPDQFMIGTSLINEAVENGNIIYVHCKYGHGRGPTMVAAYFVRYRGKSLQEALNIIKEKRNEIHIEELQYAALSEFEKKWK